MHLALYRKYRPRIFDDVVGQEHITSVLKYQASQDRVSHAYLFCGSRGTGKTSSAKILAKAVNCLSPENGNPCGKCEACLAVDSGAATDVVEMDAASNNGVDSIRELRDEVTYAPAMLRRRVYIIDEVHMLSTSAFNALLKTLEEPPEHVLFILATTELHKLPATIISRCQRFDFRRIGIEDIAGRLLYIAEHEKIALEHSAAERIARIAEGGMRDAVSLLELCAGGGAEVSEARVEEILGVSGYTMMCDTARCVAEGNMKALFGIVAKACENKDISVFWQELLSFWRDMLVAKYADDFRAYLDITEGEAEMLSDTAALFPLGTLVYQSGIMDDAMRAMIRSPQTKRVTAELAFVKMCRPEADSSAEALAARVSELEDKVRLLGAGVVPLPIRENADVATVTSKKTALGIGATERGGDAAKADAGTGKEMKKTPAADYSPVPDMSGVIEKLTRTSPMAVDFLRTSITEISADGSKIRVVPENDFAGQMLSGEDTLRALAEAFLLTGVCDVLPSVAVEKAVPKKKSIPADELFGL